MTHFRRMLALLSALLLLPLCAGASQRLPLQKAHQTTLRQHSQLKSNGAKIYHWEITTAQENVSAELNGLVQGYLADVMPTVGKPAANDVSRLDVNILHSRTGLTWMSFMVQSRYVLNKVTKDVRFTTRTYDMATGQRLMLTDIFPADSAIWPTLQSAVRDGISAYYPDLTPDAAALERACTREAVEQMDFTLHGMSLMLHLHAADFYPGKEQLIQVTLYYPDIRPCMTEKARAETDNLTYYDTVALTYDDGPTGWITREMLNVLLQKGERATFFLVGERMSGYAQYVQREHDEGHAIATHNFQHVLANEVTHDRLRTLAQKVNQTHLDIIGIAPAYARAPGGVWKPMANAELGWPLIQWSAQGTDWEGEKGREPAKVLAQVLSGMDDGAIILMHDLKRNSIDSSEQIITRLQNDGYLFLTVDELFAKDGVTLQPDTAYWRCQNGVTTDE